MLIVTVAANLITDWIRKWLDGDKSKKEEQPKED